MKIVKIKFEIIDNDNKVIHNKCISVHIPKSTEYYINDVLGLVLEKIDITGFDLIKIKRKEKSCEVFVQGEQKKIIEKKTIIYKYVKGINPPHMSDIFNYEYIKEEHECFDYNSIDRILTKCVNGDMYHNNDSRKIVGGKKRWQQDQITQFQDVSEDIKYMNKYLKYKNKYLTSKY